MCKPIMECGVNQIDWGQMVVLVAVSILCAQQLSSTEDPVQEDVTSLCLDNYV